MMRVVVAVVGALVGWCVCAAVFVIDMGLRPEVYRRALDELEAARARRGGVIDGG